MSNAAIVSLSFAIAALVVSVLSSSYQIREMRRQTQKAETQIGSNLDDSIFSELRFLSSTFMEFPSLRPIFQPSQNFPPPATSTLDHDSLLRAETICDHLMDVFERSYDGGINPNFRWDGPIWKYYEQVMCRSDFLFFYFDAHKDWWPEALYQRALDARRADPSDHSDQAVKS